MQPASHYTGRFAPSPTGPLHLGSLISAVASYLDARAHHGQWLLRIEDIDPPRELPGATHQIIDSLRHHGLRWDGDIVYQSQRGDAYEQALQQLLADGKAFYCQCSRQSLRSSGGIHRPPCRHPATDATDAAIRLHVAAVNCGFKDGIQGHYRQQLDREAGDFVLRRRDGLYAYQLAVVLDDAAQSVTHVVRGSDLLDSTPRQIYLQQQLGLPTPEYLHIPVITNAAGQKLSKQTFARPLEISRARDNLLQALRFLRQPEPPAEARHDCERLLHWSTQHWQRELVPRRMAIAQS